VPEEPAPRVTVILPGGRTASARLHARRQDETGRWWYEVTLEIPADAVRPVDGEDYSAVPTERPLSKDWVLQALPNDNPKRRSLVLHRPDCWAAQGRLEPANRDQAAVFLREGWATACDACKPDPTPAQDDS
jgi:hypothetical protein